MRDPDAVKALRRRRAATRRPAGRATGHAIERPSSTAGAPSSRKWDRAQAYVAHPEAIPADRRSPRGTPAARTRRSFAGRTNTAR